MAAFPPRLALSLSVFFLQTLMVSLRLTGK
jgi:hypothetical protein